MPNNVIKSFAKKSGKSEEEVEKLWNQAKGMASKKNLKDDAFFAFATASLKTMLNIKEDIDLEEMTGAAAVPVTAALAKGTPSGNMACGSSYFSCDDDEDLFWTLHTKVRKHRQWYKTHIGNSNITDWAKQPQNKNKSFYLQLNKNGIEMFRKIKNK